MILFNLLLTFILFRAMYIIRINLITYFDKVMDNEKISRIIISVVAFLLVLVLIGLQKNEVIAVVFLFQLFISITIFIALYIPSKYVGIMVAIYLPIVDFAVMIAFAFAIYVLFGKD